jgi:UMF1 family MFS transporter
MTESTAPLSLAGTPAASTLGYSSWMLGQAAREPLYVLVVIYIFFPYFSNVVVGDPVQGQALIGYLSAGAGMFMALTIPFLGAIADKNGRRKPWIILSYSVLGVAAIGLWWVLPADGGLGLTWGSVLILVFLIAFGYAEVFHNAMLPSVAPADKTGLISGMGFSIANLAAIMLLLLVLFAFALPGTLDWVFLPSQALFGIDPSVNGHDRIVGPLGGIWLFLAIMPLLLFTPDGEASKRPLSDDIREGLKDVLTTIRQLKHYSNIGRYLLARMFFNDGMVGVVIFSGVYASSTFGWDTTSMLILGLCTTISAMFGVFLGGLLDDRFGSLATLKIALGTMILLMLMLISIQPDTLFYIVPVSEEAVWSSPYFGTIAEIVYFLSFQVFASLFLTALSASRTLMARISPPEKVTQFFGMYSLSGSVTAFLAPLLVGSMTALFQSQRVGFASLIVLMVIGGIILLKVKQEKVAAADIHQ